MSITENFKKLEEVIKSNLEAAYQEAVKLEKSLLIILLENHYEKSGLIPQVITLNWMQQHNINNVLVEANEKVIRMAEKSTDLDEDPNFSTLVIELNKRGMIIWPADKDHLQDNATRMHNMRQAIQSIGQDAMLIIGLNHLQDIAADQALNAQYHIISFNAACISNDTYLKKVKSEKEYLEYAYNSANAKQLGYCYTKDITTSKLQQMLGYFVMPNTDMMPQEIKVITKDDTIFISNGMAPTQPYSFLANNNYHACTRLYMVSNQGDVEKVQLFLAQGDNPNTKTDYKQTALHTCKNAKIAKLLISYGADLEAKNEGWNTPYEEHSWSECLGYGDKEIIREITEAMDAQGIPYSPYKCVLEYEV
jgi:hypothetical protein